MIGASHHFLFCNRKSVNSRKKPGWSSSAWRLNSLAKSSCASLLVVGSVVSLIASNSNQYWRK